MQPVPSYLVFDFETTGLSRESDRIIQVGLCRVEAGQVTARRGWLVNQNAPIDPEAQARHGITQDDLKRHGISPETSLADLLEAMSEAPICVGHNIHRFDIPFLIAECRRLGMSPPRCDDFIDTAALYKGRELGTLKRPDESFRIYADRVLSQRVRGLKYAIPACISKLNIKVDASNIHDASEDAYLTHLIFQALQRLL